MDKRCAKCKKYKDVAEFEQKKNPRWESERYFTYCRPCNRKRQREAYWNNPDYYRSKRRKELARNRDRINKIRRKTKLKARKAAIKAYGGKCACCGETEYSFLAIDHKHGGGNKHRKVVRQPDLPYWLRKNNYPKGFQILCHNCNMATHFLGTCPHAKTRNQS